MRIVQRYEDRVEVKLVETKLVYDSGSVSTFTVESPVLAVERRFERGVWIIGGKRVRVGGGLQQVGLAEAELYTGSHRVGVEPFNEDMALSVAEEAAAHAIDARLDCSPRIEISYKVLERAIRHPEGVASESIGIGSLRVSVRCHSGIEASSTVSELGLNVILDPRVAKLVATDALITARVHASGSRLNPLHSGKWTVVLRRDAAAAVADAVATLLRGDSPSARVGEKLGSRLLEIVEDPYQPVPGHRVFDDEAVRVKRRSLVEEGEVVGYLHTRATAARMGEEPGNAVGLVTPPRPGPSVLVFKAGDWREDELLEETRRGIVVDSVRTWWLEGRSLTIIPLRAWLVQRGDMKPLIVSRIRLRFGVETATLDAVSRTVWSITRVEDYRAYSIVVPTIRLLAYVD